MPVGHFYVNLELLKNTKDFPSKITFEIGDIDVGATLSAPVVHLASCGFNVLQNGPIGAPKLTKLTRHGTKIDPYPPKLTQNDATWVQKWSKLALVCSE